MHKRAMTLGMWQALGSGVLAQEQLRREPRTQLVQGQQVRPGPSQQVRPGPSQRAQRAPAIRLAWGQLVQLPLSRPAPLVGNQPAPLVKRPQRLALVVAATTEVPRGLTGQSK